MGKDVMIYCGLFEQSGGIFVIVGVFGLMTVITCVAASGQLSVVGVTTIV